MIAQGIDMKRAFRLARQMGCEVEMLRQSGEARISHPRISKPCVVNRRRKDASKDLVVWLRRLVERLKEQVKGVEIAHRPPRVNRQCSQHDQNFNFGEQPRK